MKSRWILTGLALAIATGGLTACSYSPEQVAAQKAANDKELARTIGDRVPGKPKTCISASSATGPQLIGDTLIYRDGAKLWVNHIPDCPSLHGDPLIITKLYGSQICRNDQFRTLERGSTIPSGFCRFSDFVPYSRPKKK